MQSETGDTAKDTRDAFPSDPCGQEGWEAAGWLELPSSQRKPCRQQCAKDCRHKLHLIGVRARINLIMDKLLIGLT